MPHITFQPQNKTVDGQKNETIFDIAQQHNIAVQTACQGKATCGLCRIVIINGEDSLSPFTQDEEKHLGNVYFITKERLSCQTKIIGTNDVVVEVK